jgi:uncharacterized protein YcfJ
LPAASRRPPSVSTHVSAGVVGRNVGVDVSLVVGAYVGQGEGTDVGGNTGKLVGAAVGAEVGKNDGRARQQPHGDSNVPSCRLCPQLSE